MLVNALESLANGSMGGGADERSTISVCYLTIKNQNSQMIDGQCAVCWLTKQQTVQAMRPKNTVGDKYYIYLCGIHQVQTATKPRGANGGRGGKVKRIGGSTSTTNPPPTKK